MKHYAFVGLLSMLLLACEKEDYQIDGLREQFTFTSQITEEEYQIEIILPRSYSVDQKSYPIVYQLDGNYQTEVMAKMAEELFDADEAPELITIGIGYTNLSSEKRFSDMTAPADPNAESSGNAANFSLFLHEELAPILNKRYRIDTNKQILSGHSLGGYFALWSLLNSEDAHHMFTDYICASPSYQYFNGVIFSLESEFNYNSIRSTKRIYLGIGALEFPHLNLYFDEMTERLVARETANFSVESRRYAGLQHHETLAPIYKDGLRFIFNQ